MMLIGKATNSRKRPLSIISTPRYDLEDAFAKYGPVRDVWVARRPPGFAFVEMEDARDARDAEDAAIYSYSCYV